MGSSTGSRTASYSWGVYADEGTFWLCSIHYVWLGLRQHPLPSDFAEQIEGVKAAAAKNSSVGLDRVSQTLEGLDRLAVLLRWQAHVSPLFYFC